jgi:predicted MFS family arabinose efflux permease
MYLPAIVTVASWFERRRAIAVSISVCGSGFGTFLFSPLTTYLLEYYGFHGCMMIMAGVALQGAVFAALLRPPPRLRDSPPAEHPLQSVMRRGRRQTAVVIRFRRWFKDEVDWRLVTNWTFALYCTSSFLGGISCYVPYMFLADRAVEESGVEKQDAAWLMSAVGISNILGRLTSGILSDRKIADNAVLYSISCIVAGTATSMSIWCSTYLQYAIYACIFGYSGGSSIFGPLWFVNYYLDDGHISDTSRIFQLFGHL